jgi:hypothetical protein
VESFEMWWWRKMERLYEKWSIAHKQGGEEYPPYNIKKEGRLTGLVTSCE